MGILGAGSQAVETSGYAKDLGWDIAFYFVESGYRREGDSDAPCITPDDDLTAYSQYPVTSAVGSPKLRRRLLSQWPGTRFLTVVARSHWIAEDVHIGEDVTVAPGVYINRRVTVGDHSLVNMASTISHETAIGDYVTIGPACKIAGGVRIGDGAFLSLAAVIGPGVKIQSGAVIGAGAVVLHDVGSHEVVAGVPAKTLRHSSGWF